MNDKLGFLSIFFLGINSIIGSGIFLLPGETYAEVGLASIIVIGINAILAFFLALCFAETASIFDKNGSSFIYAKEAFGNFIGFEMGIFAWFIGIVSSCSRRYGESDQKSSESDNLGYDFLFYFLFINNDYMYWAFR